MSPQLRSASRRKRPIDKVDCLTVEVRQASNTLKRRSVAGPRKEDIASLSAQNYTEPYLEQKGADTVFRLKHIPLWWGGKEEIEAHLREALDLEKDVFVRLSSISGSPFSSDERIATLSFVPRPSALLPGRSVRGSGNEWRFHIRRPNKPDTDLTLDTNFFGFTPFHHADDHKCDIDIVALSGLNSHAFGSFKERGGSFMWLRDALPRDLPRARIFAYGYDSLIADSKSFQRLCDLGMHFRETMRSITIQNPNSPFKRPIIIIGHSLGGLVVKEAIIQMASDQANETDQTNLRSICGILLFGVPSQGMAIESLLPMASDQPNQGLLQALGKDSDVLRYQQQEFPRAFQSKHSRIYSFYETMESPTATKIDGEWTVKGPSVKLVDIASSTHGRFYKETQQPFVYPINRTHSEMVKFTARDDSQYLVTLDRLETLSQDAANIASRTYPSESSTSTKRASSEEQACLESLSFAAQNSRQDEIFEARLNGTCSWILSHEAYVEWLHRNSTVLWVQGKPGAGKSTLMKYLTQELDDRLRERQDVLASFFVHARGIEDQKTALGLYRSLLNQILAQIPDLLSDFTNENQKRSKQRGQHGVWMWETGTLKSFMETSLPKASRDQPIIICIDALDELGEDEATKIIQYFENLVTKAVTLQGSLRICFSCRSYPILAKTSSSSIHLEHQNQADIRSVTETSLRGFLPKERQELTGEIYRKAQGVFQWVTLVLRLVTKLKNQGNSFQRIWKRMQDTPPELYNLYKTILTDLKKDERYDDQKDERQQTVKLFQWMLFSGRVVTLAELQHALPADLDGPWKSISELKESQWYIESLQELEKLVNHLSRGLIEIVGPERHAQFIHESVPDYLLTSGLERMEPEAAGTPAFRGHLQISRCCIKYLQTKDIMKSFLNSITDVGLDTTMSPGIDNYLGLDFNSAWDFDLRRAPRERDVSDICPLGDYSLKYCWYHIAQIEKEDMDN